MNRLSLILFCLFWNQLFANPFFSFCSRFQFFWVPEDGPTDCKCAVSFQPGEAPECSAANAGANLGERAHFWCFPAKVHWITFCIVFVILSTQVKLWYDKVGHQLTVNVLQAVELPLRPDGRPRSAYVKIYFLPDRRYSSIVFRGWFTKESPEDSSWNHVTFSHTQRQEQTEDENSEEDLRAQMEPDVCLHSRPSQGFPQPHAGADCMGPTQVTRGRQHLHGRGTSWSTSFNLFGVPFL